MKYSRWLWYGAGLAALAVVLIVAGVPVLTALVITAVLACPLMMFSMMGGHGSDHSKAGADADHGASSPGGHEHIHDQTGDSSGSWR